LGDKAFVTFSGRIPRARLTGSIDPRLFQSVLGRAIAFVED
jgi:hypothetical protein